MQKDSPINISDDENDHVQKVPEIVSLIDSDDDLPAEIKSWINLPSVPTPIPPQRKKMLEEPQVILHAGVLRWVGLDPNFRFLDSKHTQNGRLKRPALDNVTFWFSGSCGNPHLDAIFTIASCRIGLQKHVYLLYVEEFYRALVEKDEVAAITFFYRIYLLANFGTLVLSKDVDFETTDLEPYPFLDKETAKTVMGLIYAILYTSVDDDLLGQEIADAYTLLKDDPTRLKDFVLRIIIAICRSEGQERKLTDPLLTQIAKITATISAKFKMPSPTDKLKDVELYYYAKCMLDDHPQHFDLDEADRMYFFGETVDPQELQDLKKPQEIHLPAYEDKKRKEASEDAPQPSAPQKKKAKSDAKKKDDYLPFTFSEEMPRLTVRNTKDRKIIFLSEDQDCAFKGPFHTVTRIQAVHALLDIVKLERLGVRILTPQSYHKTESNKLFVKYPILATTNKPWPLEEVLEGDNKPIRLCSQQTLGVVPYNTYIKNHPEEFVEKHFPLIYCVFLWFTMLRIGKRGLDNILVVGDQLWFVGLENEQRLAFALSEDDTNNKNFFLSKGTSKEVDTLIGKALIRHQSNELIKNEFQNIEKHLGIAGIDAANIDDNVIENAKTAFYDKSEPLGFKREVLLQVYNVMFSYARPDQ
jgi:hypothetical protein